MISRTSFFFVKFIADCSHFIVFYTTVTKWPCHNHKCDKNNFKIVATNWINIPCWWSARLFIYFCFSKYSLSLWENFFPTICNTHYESLHNCSLERWSLLNVLQFCLTSLVKLWLDFFSQVCSREFSMSSIFREVYYGSKNMLTRASMSCHLRMLVYLLKYFCKSLSNTFFQTIFKCPKMAHLGTWLWVWQYYSTTFLSASWWSVAQIKKISASDWASCSYAIIIITMSYCYTINGYIHGFFYSTQFHHQPPHRQHEVAIMCLGWLLSSFFDLTVGNGTRNQHERQLRQSVQSFNT